MAKLFREGIVKGLMFDTNVFDDLVDGRLDIASLPTGVKIFVTHIQRDELKACPNLERRKKLMETFALVSGELLPTASAVWGLSNWGESSWGGSELFNNVGGSTKNHTKDALIAETAIKEGLVLITNDKDLRDRVRGAGGESIGTADLLAGHFRPTKQTEIGEIPES